MAVVVSHQFSSTQMTIPVHFLLLQSFTSISYIDPKCLGTSLRPFCLLVQITHLRILE